MFKYLLLVTTVIGSNSSFCGCGVCSIDWKAGSITQRRMVESLSCSKFQTLLDAASIPAIKIIDGEACIDVLNAALNSRVFD